MTKSKTWIIKNKKTGMPQLEDFQLIEEVLPACSEGDIVIEAEYLSVDPQMRYRIRQAEIKSVVIGSQVAKVIESKNAEFPVGAYVIAHPGWRTHTHIPKEQLEKYQISKIPNVGRHSRSTALGVLGMPGNTAYFGFLEICSPKPGDTVVVNAAGGAVGSLVCQIAKIKGCNVIAFAGSEAKVTWLKELGINHVFNYKSCSITEVLKKAAPKGINCYFDNVGGNFTSEVLPQMAEFGRVSICGCISTYNDEKRDILAVSMNSPYSEATILSKQLKVEGFIVYIRWLLRWLEGIGQMKQWLDEGKIVFRETVTEGFEIMPQTFIGLFSGENIGKAIIKI